MNHLIQRAIKLILITKGDTTDMAHKVIRERRTGILKIRLSWFMISATKWEEEFCGSIIECREFFKSHGGWMYADDELEEEEDDDD